MSNPLTGTAAQPIGDLAEKVYNTATKYINKIPSFGLGESKPDTSWHDQMVKEANASFSKSKSTTSHTAGHTRVKTKYGK